jgi:DNA ligase-associated metallophosphoesterase
MIIDWAGESLELLPERALLWPARATLVLADPHFGKTAAFRAGGIPVPPGTTTQDLARLDSLVRTRTPGRLVILGDFFHARAGRAEDILAQIAAWRERNPQLAIDLVAGNHDRRAGAPPAAWRIRVHEAPLADGPFLFCHEPPDRVPARRYALAGHVHPAFSMEDRTSRLRAPCFLFGARRALLPAFGGFTGTRSVRPEPGERVYVVGEDEVAAVGQPVPGA